MIKVTVDGDLRIGLSLDNLFVSDQDSLEIVKKIGISAVENVRDRINLERDPEGTPWVRSARAKAQGGTTLRDKSILYNSFTYVASPGNVEWGTDIIYAKWLHFGATIRPKTKQYLTFNIGSKWVKVKSVTLVPRKILGVSEQDKEDIIRILNVSLTGDSN